MKPPSLFDAAAELLALASDKPLSQVRAELLPAPAFSPCPACLQSPCVCPAFDFAAPGGRCDVHGTPLLLEHGERRAFSCPRCAP